MVNPKIFLIILILTTEIYSSLKVLTDLDVKQQMLEYVVKVRRLQPFSYCNIIVPPHKNHCMDIVHWFVVWSRCTKIVATNNHMDSILLDTRTSLTIIVIDKMIDFNNVLDTFLDSTFYQNVGQYKFFVCEKVTVANLRLASIYAWKKEVLNLAIVFFL